MCLISEIETPTHKPQFDRPKRARIALHGLEPWVPYPSTPPIETSRFERIAPRGRVAAALRKTPRRFAAKRLGGLNSKRADLSVSYLKTI